MEKTIIEGGIIAGNKLIAEFMGEESYVSGGDLWIPVKIPGIHPYSVEVEYHSSWDWLMPVVEKIESLGFWVSINSDNVNIGDKHIEGVFDKKGDLDEIFIEFDGKYAKFVKPAAHSKIDATWQAVVQFISWYNSQGVKPAK